MESLSTVAFQPVYIYKEIAPACWSLRRLSPLGRKSDPGARMTDEQPQSSQQDLPRPEADRQAAEAAAWLSAVVENSDDAILSKTLDGVIMTWNRGAERMFGFSTNEAVGRSITMIIPDDMLAEETEILRRLRAGERIDHFETVRRRKDGEFIDISLTVSPVRNAAGEILGASKIARDISVQKRAFAQQKLLLREMNHRI
jgi:PAS domain S-box-containing protein